MTNHIDILGYANEVGEAFRSFVHVNVVRASYGVASCYVMADAAHKGQLASTKVSICDDLSDEVLCYRCKLIFFFTYTVDYFMLCLIQFQNHPSQKRFILQGVVDTLLWQGLASVIIPGMLCF